jgi:hypothetical protein
MKIKVDVTNLRRGSAKGIHNEFKNKFDPDDSKFDDDEGTIHLSFFALDAFETIALLVELFSYKALKHYAIAINWADGD